MEREAREKPPTKPGVGAMLSKIDITTLYDIADIYGRVVGGRSWDKMRGYNPEEVIDYLNQLEQGGNFVGWRFGSNFPEDKDQSGKLGVWRVPNTSGDTIIRFDYDPNVLEGVNAAENLRVEFTDTVAKYLTDRKLAVELPNR